MANNLKPKHGGARPGAGRKKSDISERELSELVKEFRRCAKQEGKPVGRLLAEVAYGIEKETTVILRGRGENKEQVVVELPMPMRLRLKAIELYYHGVITRKTETEVKGYVAHGPTIGLPPVMAQPVEEEEEHPIHG